MQRTAEIGGWRPLPYLKFCINLVREILTLIGEKSGKSQEILKTDVCGNHVKKLRINAGSHIIVLVLIPMTTLLHLNYLLSSVVLVSRVEMD